VIVARRGKIDHEAYFAGGKEVKGFYIIRNAIHKECCFFGVASPGVFYRCAIEVDRAIADIACVGAGAHKFTEDDPLTVVSNDWELDSSFVR
jgi:hypothetical protein